MVVGDVAIFLIYKMRNSKSIGKLFFFADFYILQKS